MASQRLGVWHNSEAGPHKLPAVWGRDQWAGFRGSRSLGRLRRRDQIKGKACRSDRGVHFGRGFDSRRLHHLGNKIRWPHGSMWNKDTGTHEHQGIKSGFSAERPLFYSSLPARVGRHQTDPRSNEALHQTVPRDSSSQLFIPPSRA